MKLGLLVRVLSGTAISSLTIFTALTFSNQPSYAGGATFYCGTSMYRNKSVPTTFGCVVAIAQRTEID
ncbi:MAG: hypothetical protein KI793_01910 [Rivularia sp. (in: Bacteria)]|nr:hypothetical protein [Rivularia sp. MS3]